MSKHEHPPKSSVWLSAASVHQLDDTMALAVAAGATQLKPAADLQWAAEFYATLFGYDVDAFAPDNPNSYRILWDGSMPRGSISENPSRQTRSTWIPYIRIEDPAARLPRIASLGGEVVFAPREGLRSGTLALVLDPSAAPVALQAWTPKDERQ